jgi:hypothetical protein
VSQSFGYIPKSSTLVLSKTVALLAGISSEELRSHQFNGSPVKNIYSLILNSKMKYCKIVDVHVNTMCTLTTPRICRHGFWKYHWSCLVQSCGCEEGHCGVSGQSSGLCEFFCLAYLLIPWSVSVHQLKHYMKYCTYFLCFYIFY